MGFFIGQRFLLLKNSREKSHNFRLFIKKIRRVFLSLPPSVGKKRDFSLFLFNSPLRNSAELSSTDGERKLPSRPPTTIPKEERMQSFDGWMSANYEADFLNFSPGL